MFFCTYDLTLNGQKLLYSAEMDGVLSESLIKIDKSNQKLNTTEKMKFFELKTWNGFESPHRYRYWWCQCALANVKTLILGKYRGDIVTELIYKNVDDLPLEPPLQVN